MGDVVQFKKPKPSVKHQGKSLCQHGFHKWRPDGAARFDVKRGKLVTRFVCERCGASKTELR